MPSQYDVEQVARDPAAAAREIERLGAEVARLEATLRAVDEATMPATPAAMPALFQRANGLAVGALGPRLWQCRHCGARAGEPGCKRCHR